MLAPSPSSTLPSAAAERAALVKACRVGQRDPRLEQAGRLAFLVQALELRQLHAAVDAFGFASISCDQAGDRHPILDRQCNHVGQVILVLGIPVAQLRQPLFQFCSGHHHDAGVYFPDPALHRRRILLLDDADHFLLPVTQDAAIAGGVRQLRGENCDALACRIEQAAQGLGTYQRHVAVEHQRQRRRCQLRQGLLHGMSGAKLWFLQCEHEVVARHRRAYPFSAMAMNDADAFGRQLARGGYDMRQQRFAGERMQHLGQFGIHPFALARREYDDLESHSKIIA